MPSVRAGEGKPYLRSHDLIVGTGIPRSFEASDIAISVGAPSDGIGGFMGTRISVLQRFRYRASPTFVGK
jgi:hypothetical protein